MHPSEDAPTYYVNYIEVASSQNDFSMFGVRMPTKMTSAAIEAAQKTGEFHCTPDVEIVFPVTIIQGLIDALGKQRDVHLANFGPPALKKPGKSNGSKGTD